MSHWIRRIAIIAASMLLVPPALRSEGAAASALDQLNTGTYIYGAPLDKKALMGKVVVMELWGMG